MARIIDADGHIVEPRKLWEEYVEPEFRDRVIRIERNREGLDEFWIGASNRVYIRRTHNAYFICVPADCWRTHSRFFS